MTKPVVPRLELRGLTKTFGGAHALERVDLVVMPGEIHGLLGTNGSGKSTLIKILSGFHVPDAGELTIDGRDVALPIPPGGGDVHGLAFVHQNLGLLPEATVLENLIAGDHERLNPWKINWRAEAERAVSLFREYNLHLEPNHVVAELSPVKRAQLAIVRAADRVSEHSQHDNPGLLILDEPTPFLPQEDVRELFCMMRGLVASGVSIIFVSHDIDEVMEVTDRVTILRDGRVTGRFEPAETGRAKLVEAIVGRSVSGDRTVAELKPSAPAVRLSGLVGKLVRDFSLELQPGEVLGLTGLIGSGYDEIPALLAGASQAQAGRLELDGNSYELRKLTPSAAIAAGVSFIPADRQTAGIAPDLNLTENATLPILNGSFALRHGRLAERTREIIRNFFVKADREDQPASELSGGNQQKLILGKWLQLHPKILLLDEPTQGIDVGARREIFDRLGELSAAGGMIICATSEFEQLETIAHRVLVFDRGRVKAELIGDEITKSAIATACYEGNGQNAAA